MNKTAEERNPFEWMQAAINALRLELPSEIVDDVQKRWNAAKAYAAQFKQQSAGVWVKASERLPDKFSKNIIFRMKNGMACDCKFWFDGDGKRTHIEPNSDSLKHYMDSDLFVEWLDESQQSQPQTSLTDEDKPLFYFEDLQVGDRVFFVEATEEQIRFGSNTDPRKLLKVNTIYEVENIEVHSWHTKIYLKGVEGKFNSVHFRKAALTNRQQEGEKL